jgi:hypothetical protein
MFQGWSFQVDAMNDGSAKYRRAMEAELADMREVWREHVENFST